MSYVWDDGSTVNAKLKLNNASLDDVLDLAGQKGKYPVTGTLSVNGQAQGTLKALSGSGEINLLTDGAAYGERYESVLVDATVQGKQIEATQLLVKLHGMQIAGNGGYNMATEQVHAHVEGDNLAAVEVRHGAEAEAAGRWGAEPERADAKGTVTEPGLQAKAEALTKLTYNGQPLGEVSGGGAHVKGKTVFTDAELDAGGRAAGCEWRRRSWWATMTRRRS